MNALRKLHSALVPGGLLLDMQPLGGRVPVESAGVTVGTLDMREWSRTVAAVAAQIDGCLAEGLFSAAGERRYDVRDEFGDSTELLETASQWNGATIPRQLARRIRGATPPLAVVQPVRMRVLRCV